MFPVTPADRRRVLLIASLGAFLTPFTASAVTVALPTIGAELHAGAVLLGWLAAAFPLASAVFLVPLGRLADMHGREPVFTAGVAVYTAGAAFCALAESGAALMAGRIVQGLGGAMIFGTGTALISACYPAGQRGRALGWNVAAVYTGLSCGPVLGGLLTRLLGWRSLFWLNLPFGILLLAFILATGVFRRTAAAEPLAGTDRRFDVAGALSYAAGLVALLTGFSRLPQLTGVLLLAAGVVLLAGFVARELRVDCPVLDVRLLAANRPFAFSNLAALINYSATAGTGLLLSLYLQYNRQLSVEQAGIVLIAQPVMQAVFSPLAGRLSDRVAPGIVASVGMALTVAGLLLFAFLQSSTPLVLVVLNLTLLGLAFALFSSPNTNAIMGSVERQQFGLASGMVATMRSIGQVLSMGIALLLFSLFLGAAAITPANAPRFLSAARVAFLVFAVLCAFGVLASLSRGRTGVRQGAGASGSSTPELKS